MHTVGLAEVQYGTPLYPASEHQMLPQLAMTPPMRGVKKAKRTSRSCISAGFLDSLCQGKLLDWCFLSSPRRDVKKRTWTYLIGFGGEIGCSNKVFDDLRLIVLCGDAG